MKTRITLLLIVGGFLATAAFPETASVTPAPALVVYAPQLPSVVELTRVAAAQGLTIRQIDQTAREVTCIYLTSDGQTKTVLYQLLPNAGSSQVVTTAPTFVYAVPAAPVYCFDPLYPAYWYPSVSIRLAYGFHGGRR